MVVPTKMCPSDSSISSDMDDLSFDEKRVQIFAKQMLSGRLFMGAFQEKRYVESLNNYRDVICISREEQELIHDITVVKQRIDDLYPGNHWVGITSPDMAGAPASYSVWVELPEDVTFGAYWFRIRKLKFRQNEVCLRVKIVRAINHDANHQSGDAEEVFSNNTFSSEDILNNVKQNINEKLHYFLKNVTTFSNFKESIKFLFMLLATLITCLFEILKHLSEFLLKFMNEFSKFLKSSAPIFQIFANLIDRLFRTLCMLIAVLIRGQTPRPPPPNPYDQPRYIPYQNLKALPAPTRRRGVIIEEIE